MTAMSVAQGEFERFAAALVTERRPVTGSRGPQPSITAQFIYEYALEFVDCEGVDALTVRRLAADLNISTRTLYKRIGSRTNMIRELVDMHWSRLDLEFHPCSTWEDTIWAWCVHLHQVLTARPHLTLMAQDRTPVVVAPLVEALIESSVDHGIPEDVAVECCWSLADMTTNDAIGVARELGHRHASHAAPGSVGLSKTTADAIKWILRGISTEVESVATQSDRG